MPGLRGIPGLADLADVAAAWPNVKDHVKRVIVELATTPANRKASRVN